MPRRKGYRGPVLVEADCSLCNWSSLEVCPWDVTKDQLQTAKDELYLQHRQMAPWCGGDPGYST